MPKKKIIVENIDDNDNKNDSVIDNTEIPPQMVEPVEIPSALIENPLPQSKDLLPQDKDPQPQDKDPKQVQQNEKVEKKEAHGLKVEEPTETKTRSQELIKCPKCNKMVTMKTLKYSHKKTCKGEENNKKNVTEKQEPEVHEKKSEVHEKKPEVNKKQAIVINDIEDVPQKPPKIVRQQSVIQQQVMTTPEMMKEHRKQIMRERMQLRQERMNNLFANSIK